jgi:Tfp pilus assembly protein PilO
MPPEVFAPFMLTMTLIFGAGVVLILRGPVGRALARRIEGQSGAAGELATRVEELESRIAELEQERARTAELEERVDFAERLLARQDPSARELPR